MNKVICLAFSLPLDLFPIPTLLPTDNSPVFATNLWLFAVSTGLTSNQNKATVLLDSINLAYNYCSSFHVQPQPRPVVHWKLTQLFLPCWCLSLRTLAPAKVPSTLCFAKSDLCHLPSSCSVFKDFFFLQEKSQ